MEITEMEHPSITAENREEFSTHMAKFTTMEDAALDGMALKKLTGVPFKMPESLDNLPDDASRSDFTSKARSLLGIKHASTIEDLADLNLRAGGTDDMKVDETLAANLKKFIVDEKMSLGATEKFITFFNREGTRVNAGIKAAQDQAALDKLAAIKDSNDALVAHKDFGNQDTVDKQTIRLHRALKDNTGMTPEAAEDVAEFLKSREGATNPNIRRLLLNHVASLAAESSVDGGDGHQAAEKVKSEQDKQVDKDLGWE